MVSTRSTRASTRLRKQREVSSVSGDMADNDDNIDNGEDNMENEEEEVVEQVQNKNDIGCKKCLEEEVQESSKKLSKKQSQVRFNDVIETHEVETEYDKPSKTAEYLQGFAKRVVICTLFVMIGKFAWPKLQPIVWPEEPIKVRHGSVKVYLILLIYHF